MAQAVFEKFVVGAAVFLAAVVLPEAVLAHLLNGNNGPVDAFNYDEGQLKHLDSDCAASFECKPNDVNGVYFYNCYYDVYSSECQCSEGEFSRCNVGKSSLSPSQAASLSKGFGRGFPFTLVGMAVGSVKGAFEKFGALPILAKIVILLLAAAAVVFIYNRLKDNAANNLRNAAELHDRATSLHEKGDEETARLLFEKANYYREKAFEQKG